MAPSWPSTLAPLALAHQPPCPPARGPAPAHPPLAPGSLQLLPGPRPSAGPQRTTSLICLPRVFCGTPAAARRAPGRPRHCREWRPRLHSWLGRGEEDPGTPHQAVRAGSPPCAPCARRALSAAVAPSLSPSPGAALAPAAPTPPPGCSPSRASKLLGVDVRRTSSQASTGLPAPKHRSRRQWGKQKAQRPPCVASSGSQPAHSEQKSRPSWRPSSWMGFESLASQAEQGRPRPGGAKAAWSWW